MKISNLKFSIGLLLVYAIAILGVVGMSGCPKKDGLRAAIEASYRLPASTNDVIKQVTDARDRGIISVEQSQKFGKLLNDMAKAEVVFVGMVKAANAVIDAGGKVPPGQLSDLKTYFDAAIIGPFLDVLKLIGVMSGDDVQLILMAVTAVRLLLRTIGSGIGSQLMNKLAGNGFAGVRLQNRGFIYA